MKKSSFFSIILILISSFFQGINANNLPEPQQRYFLIVSARGASIKPFSLTGHAFVSWAIQRKGDTALIAEQTLGFYPNKEADLLAMAFDTLQGRIEATFLTNSNHNSLIEQVIVELDSSDWAKSKEVELSWKNKAYNLFNANCVCFVDRVLAMTSLKRAKTRWAAWLPVRPLSYITQLRAKNKNRIAAKRVKYME